MAVAYYSSAFYYYLFIFFLVFIPGITQTRLPAALKAEGAAGGAGHA
jgi:hypothetical protein